MRIQVLSDLHLEFDGKGAKGFIDSLDPEGIDVLVLAGDICVDRQIVDVMCAFCQRYESSDVVWVHGNHEFYGSNRETVVAKTQEATRQCSNLHWLDCSAAEIRGQRFVGAPMWFIDDDHNQELERFMNDFHVISDLKRWVYRENLRATNFIKGNAGPGDIVVTHHLPSNLSVADRFKSSDLNRFFVCDMEHFIRTRGPKLWVHGHTHDSFDYEIPHELDSGSTRVLCNPRGYFPRDLNPDFNDSLVIEA